jgi:hypothetical protein
MMVPVNTALEPRGKTTAAVVDNQIETERQNVVCQEGQEPVTDRGTFAYA